MPNENKNNPFPFAIMTQLEERIKESGFNHFGFAPLSPALTIDFYREWLKKGYHGEMKYLQNHLPKKENPSLYEPKAHSAIVIAQDYASTSIPEKEHFPLKKNKIARYAQGKDYHYWFKGRLQELAESFQLIVPHEHFLVATDSAPILERDLAYRAGLGWVGKNTCLIHRRHGSFFLIGEIITSLNFSLLSPSINLSADHCGSCRRCIDACPTNALLEPKKLDARRCISYWTIESHQIPPESLRHELGSWLFGCDICQEVCPWNKKVLSQGVPQQLQEGDSLEKELRYILTASNRQLMRDFASTPLQRAGGNGLKRNAIIVATHHHIYQLDEIIQKFSSHKYLGELAQWSYRILFAIRKNSR